MSKSYDIRSEVRLDIRDKMNGFRSDNNLDLIFKS